MKVVVEVMGGTDLAKTVVTSALRSGKHVVTANKALIAAHLPELNALVETVNAGRQTKVHSSRSQYVTKPVALHNTGCRPVWSRGRSVDAQPYGCRLSLHCCGLSLHCCGFSLHGCGFSLIAPRPAPRSASLQHAPWVPKGAYRLPRPVFSLIAARPVGAPRCVSATRRRSAVVSRSSTRCSATS